jgi:hypothetical protein
LANIGSVGKNDLPDVSDVVHAAIAPQQNEDED